MDADDGTASREPLTSAGLLARFYADPAHQRPQGPPVRRRPAAPTPVDHAGRDDALYIPLTAEQVQALAAGETVWQQHSQAGLPPLPPREPGPGRQWLMLVPRPPEPDEADLAAARRDWPAADDDEVYEVAANRVRARAAAPSEPQRALDQLLRFTAWLCALDHPVNAEERARVTLDEIIARAAAAAADGSDGS